MRPAGAGSGAPPRVAHHLVLDVRDDALRLGDPPAGQRASAGSPAPAAHEDDRDAEERAEREADRQPSASGTRRGSRSESVTQRAERACRATSSR